MKVVSGQWSMGSSPVRSCCVVLFLIFHFSFLISSCARQGYPSGGPKDTAPPKVLGCTPQNESRDFAAREFTVQFDEYVVLKNADNNVIISPPMQQKPEFSVKGKSVVVRLKDTLKADATYLFQFKEAIADFTEGNLLPSFEYVFSTGAVMDTMMMAGRVLDARSAKPWKETVTLMAYREGDTMPAFVTRADKEGNFAFHYIPAGSYRLVALEDKNRNMKVDADESVAWLDEPVTAIDSIDSSLMARMRLSEPEARRQRVVGSKMVAKGRIVVTTALPMRNPVVGGEQTIQRLNATRDTLTLWCVNPLCDSAVIIISDTNLQDTLRLRYTKPRRGRPAGAPQSATETLMTSLCSGNQAYYDRLQVAFLNPIASQNEEIRAEITAKKDSSRTSCTLTLDSSRIRATINADLKAGEEYQVRIPARMFTDIYGNTTDSMLFKLTPRDYAILTLHIDNRTGTALVIELLNAKDSAIVCRPLAGSGTVRIDHIAGGSYRLRAVVDTDGNGSWTTGNYPVRQPEQFIYFEKTLQLRERWEVEEKWEVQ